MYTSASLTIGNVYSRQELADLFEISDASINNGVFRPKGHESIWLFVTEAKSSDPDRYHNELRGDVLEWDGQRSGRTDHWIAGHKDAGAELRLFYRRSSREFPRSGFKYLGPVEYQGHTGTKPAHFTLRLLSH